MRAREREGDVRKILADATAGFEDGLDRCIDCRRLRRVHE